VEANLLICQIWACLSVNFKIHPDFIFICQNKLIKQTTVKLKAVTELAAGKSFDFRFWIDIELKNYGLRTATYATLEPQTIFEAQCQ
jgi:hypothetical protein